MTETRYGPQPIIGKMNEHRWMPTRFAHEIHEKPRHVKNAMRGVVRPSRVLREQAPRILGVPLEELFTAAALEPPNTGHPAYDPNANRQHPFRNPPAKLSS